jgi:hypothetical protein
VRRIAKGITRACENHKDALGTLAKAAAFADADPGAG